MIHSQHLSTIANGAPPNSKGRAQEMERSGMGEKVGAVHENEEVITTYPMIDIKKLKYHIFPHIYTYIYIYIYIYI